MTPAQEVETSVAQNNPIRDYFHPEDHIVTSTNIDKWSLSQTVVFQARESGISKSL